MGLLIVSAHLSAHAEEVGALLHALTLIPAVSCAPTETDRDGAVGLLHTRLGAHQTWIFLELSTLGDYYEFATESVPSPNYTSLENSQPVLGGWRGSSPTGVLRNEAFSFSPTSQWVSDLNGRRNE